VRGSLEGDARRPTGQDRCRHSKETTQDDGTGLGSGMKSLPRTPPPSSIVSF